MIIGAFLLGAIFAAYADFAYLVLLALETNRMYTIV